MTDAKHTQTVQSETVRTERVESEQDGNHERPRRKRSWIGPVLLLLLIGVVGYGVFRGVKWIRESRAVRIEAVQKDERIAALEAERDGLKKAAEDAVESIQALQVQVDELRTRQAHPAGRTREVVAERTDDRPRLNTHHATLVTKSGG